jgi:F0F1-type ATP synthase assembly protein I
MDLWFSSSPRGLLTGFIVGCLAGFANLIGSLRR